MQNTTVFLTGATGFLGTQIARRLLKNEQIKLIVLVRAADENTARERLRREWWDAPDIRDAAHERVQVVPGDVTLPLLGLDPISYADLTRQITHIIHSAADVRLFEPLEILRPINVEGTRHVLELARAVQSAHGLTRFAHVSTAYVAGERRDPVAEDELSNQSGFSCPYEQSKYEAEVLVRQAMPDFPVSVFRPGMIVGDSQNGTIKTFNTVYYPLRLYLTGVLSTVPANPNLRINLVPVDYVADAVSRLTLDPQAAGLTFHLTPPLEDQPTLAEMTVAVRGWAKQRMGLELPRPHFVPIPGISRFAGGLKKILPAEIASLLRFLPYFLKQPVFLRENSDRLLGKYPHRWQNLLPPLLEYAVHYSFWHRTSRTVHEQVLFRLQSRSKPIGYHDIIDGQDRPRSAAEMDTEIRAVLAAFQSMGVQPGNRIAMVGLNSTRHFAIMIAAGLCGAVIVPFYVTCPPDEMERLLADCQPRLFLVGAPAILARIDEIHFAGKMASFCREAVPEHISSPVLPWNEFLAQGNETEDRIVALAPDAPAVLYYTSGTTGQPKGVLFQHAQLRWLAETLASMYPWYERNRRGSYLSYLPMNHVVEGVLASYSPYYVPAALDLYFLEQFSGLQQALTYVRPTIFFSVPRFFEKVRAAALENPLIRTAQTLPPDSPVRRLLRGVLRRGLLRKAGLDKSPMMIVGSAPSDAALLKFFDDLGIPIHDAYGLTEAPLITLNRLGRNRTGTLGEPLPETEIQIAADGEICARGPQMAAGYVVNGVLEPFEDGWLETGDIGQLDSDGYLTLNGRKKDLIITSYAKNIFPAPIEAQLRAIPGVAEAILVGDGRPYCIALLWMESGNWNSSDSAALEAGVITLNRHLSHPEQIKRWVILAGHLSAESGELTGSMKVKRGLIAGRLASVIDEVYQGHTPPGVLYCGGVQPDGIR